MMIPLLLIPFLFSFSTNTRWSKSLCASDDYNTIVWCTDTFWSLCIYIKYIKRSPHS